jgi:hypothetical protein
MLHNSASTACMDDSELSTGRVNPLVESGRVGSRFLEISGFSAG